MKYRVLFAAFLAFSAAAAAPPQIAFTFDDLPAHSALPPGMTRVEIAKSVIAGLQAAQLPPATGFVNGALIEREPDSAPVLELWRRAGFFLANHTWSHPNLDDVTTEAFQADITRNEPVLDKYAGGSDWHWFRYPYLAEGDAGGKRAEIRSFLAQHGYRIAPATMMFGDWLYSEPYARCLAKGDTAAVAVLAKDYLAAAEENIRYYRAMSQMLYGRDIPYVLLLHLGAFEAKTLPDLIALYRAKGFEFVTLETAEREPYYRPYVDPSLPVPPPDFEHRMKDHGLHKMSPPKDHGPDLAAMCR